MFLIKFFWGRFSSCRNGRAKSSSSRGKEEEQSWGGKRKQKWGRKNRDDIFLFFFKWEIRTLLTFPTFPNKSFVLDFPLNPLCWEQHRPSLGIFLLVLPSPQKRCSGDKKPLGNDGFCPSFPVVRSKDQRERQRPPPSIPHCALPGFPLCLDKHQRILAQTWPKALEGQEIQDLPLRQRGVCLWFGSWAGGLGFRACQEEGTACSSRE